MELFTSRLDPERLARAADVASRAADREAVLGAVTVEPVGLLTGNRLIAFVGSETPRERVWLQIDACSDDVAAALVSWAAVESLTSERPGQYRIPVAGRARVAVVFGDRALPLPLPDRVPFLDAGLLGAEQPLLSTMRRFAPSFVLHVQDWTSSGAPPLEWRVIESFYLDPTAHGELPPSGAGPRFSPARRAFRIASSSPDWRVGARAMGYVRRLGIGLREIAQVASSDEHTVHRVEPGRYVPALPFRRLAGGSLAELALSMCGAHAMTLQLRGGEALERATLALAFAEAAIVHRMGLVQPERSA